MNNKIAIIDAVNQDIGLKILFPKADYYINNSEECTIHYRCNSYIHYNFIPNTDWSKINDKNYEYLFILLPIYDSIESKLFFKQNILNIFNRVEKILDQNNFKKVMLFDNYDYDYDPNDFFVNEKINYIFKRNYNNLKTYKKNVFPFPFIMFGETSLIEKCDRQLVSEENYFKNKIDRVFFSGSLLNHQDVQYGVSRNRNIIYNEIKNTIFNPGNIDYSSFLNTMQTSKFCLDLLGVGEPNKRTIEILLSGSLMLSEKNNLKWPFEEEFSKETIFSDHIDYFEKLKRLREDSDLYNKCLKQQYYIVNKYFNIKWLKNYICNIIN